MHQWRIVVVPAAIVNHFHFNTMWHGPLDWVCECVWAICLWQCRCVRVCDGIVFVTKYNHKRNLIAPNRVCHVLASHRYRYEQRYKHKDTLLTRDPIDTHAHQRTNTFGSVDNRNCYNNSIQFSQPFRNNVDSML